MITTDSPSAASSGALAVVEALSEQLERLDLPLDLAGADRARVLQRRVRAQLETHLVPRLRDASSPTLVVVGGPTGAGKSTLVNAVAGAEVTQVGAVRPTTREPVLVVNPSDAELMAAHPVAARARLVTAPLPRGLALLDAPDLDSVAQENRAVALDLAEAGDVWLFVTTATRYADALPWDVLREVHARGITVGIVLDRVGADALDSVRRDLRERLIEAGLEASPMFVVPDAGPLSGPLPAESAREVSSWLRIISSGAASREVVARTVRGVWEPLRQDVGEVLAAVDAQLAAAADLKALVRAAGRDEAEALVGALGEGALAEGAVSTTWEAAAGTRGVLEPLVRDVRGVFARRRALRAVPEREQTLARAVAQLRQAFGDVVGRSAARVAASTRRAWEEHSDAGAHLVSQREPAADAAERTMWLETAWNAWISGEDLSRARAGADSEPPLSVAGSRALLALAAAGLPGASAAVERLDAADPAAAAGEVARASQALREAARSVLTAQQAAYTDLLAARLDPGAAAALRARVDQVRGLLGEQADGAAPLGRPVERQGQDGDERDELAGKDV